MPLRLPRRQTLALLAAALPLAARAQDTSQPTVIAPPAPVPTPAPNPAIAAQAPSPPKPPTPPPGIDKTKRYIVMFDAVIDPNSMRILRHQLNTLVEAGVTDIDIVMHSPGGAVDAMLVTYAFIRALPARITTHANGFVQSAATILFLAGDDRSADPTARFLFHPSIGGIAGLLNSAQVQDRLNEFAAFTSVETEIFHDRTTLADSEIARFGREEVIYTPAQALDAGVVQHVRDLHIPGPDKARVVFLD